ncbi:hypothetical protein GCM10010530_16670 [Kribbella aluminosa]
MQHGVTPPVAHRRDVNHKLNRKKQPSAHVRPTSEDSLWAAVEAWEILVTDAVEQFLEALYEGDRATAQAGQPGDTCAGAQRSS